MHTPDAIETTTLLDTARSYLSAGLCVLPAIGLEKRPAVAQWKQFQTHRPTEEELRGWFGPHTALCMVMGRVSQNAELLDFDQLAELYPAWRELVESEAPGLADRLVRERSQNSGLHGVYRCMALVPGGEKLAQRAVRTADDKPVTIHGKNYKPRWANDHWEVVLTLIETRGEGNICVCHPSPGYVLEQGRFEELPVLTAEEREVLVRAARSLDELPPKAEPTQCSAPEAGGRPGDDYNERGDVRALLLKHGWALVKPGENEYWRRPGKDRGWSATLRGRVFYCFSSNAAPFEEQHAYAPFSVYTLLEHGGDFGKAAATLRGEGYGAAPSCSDDVDLSRFQCGEQAPASTTDILTPPPEAWPDPEPIPDALPPVMPFDEALLPASVRPWIMDIAERMQCPPDFPAVGAMIALASLVGRKLAIRPKQHDDWTVVPNLWGAIIGPPSVMKSPPLKEVLKPLHRLVVQAQKSYEQAVLAYENEASIEKLKRSALEAQIKGAMKARKDYDELVRQMESLASPERPTRRRYAINDTTVEKLQQLLNENPNGLLVQRDELIGFLRYLDRDGQE